MVLKEGENGKRADIGEGIRKGLALKPRRGGVVGGWGGVCRGAMEGGRLTQQNTFPKADTIRWGGGIAEASRPS